MLFSQQLGGGHDGRLIAILDRDQRGEQSHDRLAAANIALQQAMHPAFAGHVRDDLTNGLHLRIRELEWKRLAQLRRKRALVLELDPGAYFASETLGPLVQQVNEEQLLERQARSSAHCLGDRERTMDELERFADARHSDALEQVGRQVFLDLREQRIQVRIEDRANDLERKPFCGRIDREDAPLSFISLLSAEIDVLARLELAPVEEANRSRHEEQVALVDASIEKWLARPPDFDHPAVILEDGLEYSKPSARRDNALRDHAADDRPLHSRFER